MYAVGESERASLGCENEVRGSCVEDLEGGKAAALRKVKVRAGKLGSFMCSLCPDGSCALCSSDLPG